LLLATDWTAGGRFPTGSEDFHIRIGSSAHAAFNAVGTGCPPSRGKTAGEWNWSLTSIQYRMHDDLDNAFLETFTFLSEIHMERKISYMCSYLRIW